METTAVEEDKNTCYEETREIEMAFGPKPKIVRSPVTISKKISAKTTRDATPIEKNKPAPNKKLMKPLGANPRTTSLTDIRSELLLNPSEDAQQTPKRKRNEMSPAGAQGGESCKATQLITIMDRISLLAKTIGWIVDDTYNCKKDLKAATARLLAQVEKYQKSNMDEWLEELKSGANGNDAVQKLEYENMSLSKRIQVMEELHSAELEKQLQTIPMQCEMCLKKTKTEARKSLLTKVIDYDNYKKITEDDWEEDIFPNLESANGPLSEATAEWDLILPCNEDFVTEDRAVMYTIRKLGGKEGLDRQNKRTGQTAMMTHTLGFPQENGEYTYVTREVHYPIIYQKEPSGIIDDKRMFEMLADIKSHMATHSRTKLAIPELEDINGIIFYRMARYLFADSNIQILAYRRQNKQNKVKVPSTSIIRSENSTAESGKNINKNRSKPEAVLVKMEGKSYTDVLQTVKMSINPVEVGVEVTGLKKTKKGDLLVMVKKGSEKADTLRKTISEKVPDAKATLLSRKKVFHLKNLDELATEEEIREAVAKELSISSETVEVRALRPAFGGRQNATVILAESIANKLSGVETIRVGWMACKIVERAFSQICYRCWEPGHIKNNCSGPDRERLCLKCGQPGHKIASCTNEEYCLTCRSTGHQTNSRKCPKVIK